VDAAMRAELCDDGDDPCIICFDAFEQVSK
jgi:hypothetical protein